MAMITKRRRIAITGLAQSGKSVLLACLLNHLKNHDPTQFPLVDGHAIRDFQEHDVPPCELFPYSAIRNALGQDLAWPVKTKDYSRYRCAFRIGSGWRGSDRYDVEFRDFPGERFADVFMHKWDYGDWSDFILSWLESPTQVDCATDFLATVQGHEPDEAAVLTAYKHALYNLASKYRPLISPSTFLLDRQGKQALNDQPRESLVASRYIGLGPDLQFAPLPASARRAAPALERRFATNYGLYRDQLVRPFVRRFQECDRLIVVVDVCQILMAGPGMLNDMHDVLFAVLGVACPRSRLLFRLAKGLWSGVTTPFIQLRPGGVSKVCFVATKADMVCRADHGNLRSLLQQLVQGAAGALPNVAYAVEAASAIVSTAEGTSPRNLRARLASGADGSIRPATAALAQFTPPEIPDCWPGDWAAGGYLFPSMYPCIPRPVFNPPAQYGLDTVLKFLLGK